LVTAAGDDDVLPWYEQRAAELARRLSAAPPGASDVAAHWLRYLLRCAHAQLAPALVSAREAAGRARAAGGAYRCPLGVAVCLPFPFEFSAVGLPDSSALLDRGATALLVDAEADPGVRAVVGALLQFQPDVTERIVPLPPSPFLTQLVRMALLGLYVGCQLVGPAGDAAYCARVLAMPDATAAHLANQHKHRGPLAAAVQEAMRWHPRARLVCDRLAAGAGPPSDAACVASQATGGRGPVPHLSQPWTRRLVLSWRRNGMRPPDAQLHGAWNLPWDALVAGRVPRRNRVAPEVAFTTHVARCAVVLLRNTWYQPVSGPLPRACPDRVLASVCLQCGYCNRAVPSAKDKSPPHPVHYQWLTHRAVCTRCSVAMLVVDLLRGVLQLPLGPSATRADGFAGAAPVVRLTACRTCGRLHRVGIMAPLASCTACAPPVKAAERCALCLCVLKRARCVPVSADGATLVCSHHVFAVPHLRRPVFDEADLREAGVYLLP
jgi:hypothetical protein